MDAFNRMAADIAASRRRLEKSSIELQNRHEEVEGRRRYVETILERIATGVISVDPAGRIRTWNSAASRLLGIDARGYRDRLDQAPACLNVLDFRDPVRVRLIAFNDTNHYNTQARVPHESLSKWWDTSGRDLPGRS